MKSVYFALFSGISLPSKLIKFWTRSKRSHSAYVADLAGLESYKFGSLIEAWRYPKEPIWKMRTIRSHLGFHSPGTKITIYELKVTDEQFQKIDSFQKVCAWLEVPYDWKAIVSFVIPRKLKRDGHLFCSEKDCLSLKYAGLLHEKIECWKVSPDRFEDILLLLGAKPIKNLTL